MKIFRLPTRYKFKVTAFFSREFFIFSFIFINKQDSTRNGQCMNCFVFFCLVLTLFCPGLSTKSTGSSPTSNATEVAALLGPGRPCGLLFDNVFLSGNSNFSTRRMMSTLAAVRGQVLSGVTNDTAAYCISSTYRTFGIVLTGTRGPPPTLILIIWVSSENHSKAWCFRAFRYIEMSESS